MDESNYSLVDFKEGIFTTLNRKLFSKEFTLKDLDVTARVLQYWSDNGILTDEERKEDENHKLNFSEYVWIKVIIELRKFGFAIPKIKKAKEILLTKRPLLEFFNVKTDEEITEFFRRSLSNAAKKEIPQGLVKPQPELLRILKKEKISLFDFILHIILLYRSGIDLVFFDNNDVSLVFEDFNKNLPENLNFLKDNTHIRLPLLKLIIKFLGDSTKFAFVKKFEILNSVETTVLEHIRKGRYDKITIHFKNNKPFILEGKSRVKLSAEARISDILFKGGYEKIEIDTEGGNIVYSSKATKHKL